MEENDFTDLIKRFRQMFPEADAARIIAVGGKLFLVLGYNRNTKDDPGQWVDQDGKGRDWDYVHAETVASGDTEADLIASAEYYKRLQGMKWSDYFREELGAKDEIVGALQKLGL